MAKASRPLRTRSSNQRFLFVIFSLFTPAPLISFHAPTNSYVAHALATNHARVIRPGTQIGASRCTNNGPSLFLPVKDIMEMDDSSGYNKEQESRSRRRWSRKNAVLRVKKSVTVFASVIASSFLLAVKPASAVELSSILSSATELLKTATTTANPTTSPSSSYLLTRILFLRFLAIVYTAAFSVAKFQNKGLIGDNGISPARNILNAADRRGEAKSARRKEWLEQRKNYTSTASSNNSTNFVVKCKNKLLDCPPATAFRDKFWHRIDRRDRPLPTLLWFARDRNNLNPWLDGLANVGLILSAMMFATGSANVVLMLGLWLIQRSFMAVGGSFYGYGWEPQLAELTFHALFLVPMLSMNPFFGSEVVPAAAAVAAGGVVSTSGMVATKGAFPVPTLVIYGIRWYLFKIMIGAGLIKAKSSDPKWKPGNMSAMDYFYETQPVPNPFTRYFHFMPKAWHRFEVWSNHFVELVAPFLLLMPFRSLRLAGGLIQIMFQFILISSGNLRWFAFCINLASDCIGLF